MLSILSSFDDANSPCLKADSGATKTYLKPAHMTYLKKITTLLDPTKIYLPNNTCLTPTVSGVLNLHPNLPEKAQEAKIVPGLSNSSLFPLVKLVMRDVMQFFQKSIYK